MRSDKFGSQLDRESKTWFFTFLNVYVSWIEWDKILSLQFLPPKFKYFADQNRSKGGSHENEFWEFSDTKINITDSKSSKSGWKKNGVVCLVSFFPSWVMVVKLQKIVHFLQIYTDLSKKSKFIKAIFYIHFNDLIMLFRKILCLVWVWTTAHKISRIKL